MNDMASHLVFKHGDPATIYIIEQLVDVLSPVSPSWYVVPSYGDDPVEAIVTLCEGYGVQPPKVEGFESCPRS